MPAGEAAWRLEGFLDHFGLWTQQENPGQNLRIAVLAWIMTRYEDPYVGVRREPGFDNLWFGEVPQTRQ